MYNSQTYLNLPNSSSRGIHWKYSIMVFDESVLKWVTEEYFRDCIINLKNYFEFWFFTNVEFEIFGTTCWSRNNVQFSHSNKENLGLERFPKNLLMTLNVIPFQNYLKWKNTETERINCRLNKSQFTNQNS